MRTGACPFWQTVYDPNSDGGITPWSHTRLREMIRTPLLMGERVNRVEQRMDFVLQKATDFCRIDVNRHGLTGSLSWPTRKRAISFDEKPFIRYNCLS